MSASVSARHADWLSLVEPTGPWLTLPVLNRAWPAGLDRTPQALRAEVRSRLADLDSSDPAARTEWLEWILANLCGWGERLVGGAQRPVPERLCHLVVEHAHLLRPDYALVEPANPATGAIEAARVVVMVQPSEQSPTARITGERWSASPIERLALLCRATGVEVGLLTDGAVFSVIWVPRDSASGRASFDARLFSEEPALLDALRAVIGAPRFFAVPPSDRVEALLAESAGAQAEVTGTLGRQVRQAVELLVGTISRANLERDRVLPHTITPRIVYEAAVTVMMRLVFVLAAEERQLLPLGDDLYDRSYAASTMLATLRADADRQGDEALERSNAAWCRLLALFRVVHGGVDHDRLRIPAYGGSLFDPERLAFLEGRGADGPADLLPIDDLTVLAVLRSICELELRSGGVTETRRLTYRNLDVEQIGNVYEGLLDHSALPATEVFVGLVGRPGLEPEVALSELEAAAGRGRGCLLEWLTERTFKTPKALTRSLDAPVEADVAQRLRAAVDNDENLAERLWPFAHLLRPDLRGLPVVFPPGAMFVTQTGAKRDSGTAYTTRALADEVVVHALEPLAYSPGPAQGVAAVTQNLRSSAELLALRVCDPACGSGAFLVAACRYLSDRLVEAWAAEGAHSGLDSDDLAMVARRAVVDHCLYGVDRDPMAVEMAKLSLWLVTMARERPFSFLDHAIKPGDSLLGLTDLNQVRYLHMDPTRGRALHATIFEDLASLDRLVARALDKRRALAAIEVVTVRDAEDKARLDAESSQELEALRVVADAVVGAALSAALPGAPGLDARLIGLSPRVARVFDPASGPAAQAGALASLEKLGLSWLDLGRPTHAPRRHPLHWPLAFPEVFVEVAKPGFDAIVGNPPFVGGKRISAPMGADYRAYLVRWLAGGTKGNADLVAYFFLRASQLSHGFGMLATNTIAQGDTREVALDRLVSSGWTITRAVKSIHWPGEQTLEIAKVWMTGGSWKGEHILDDQQVSGITAFLDPLGRVMGKPERLFANASQSFIGSLVNGIGFVLSPDEYRALIGRNTRNADVLFQYVNGEDLNRSPTGEGSRWIINFSDWTLERANKYPDCVEIVRTRVKPQRDRLPDYKSRVRTNWWRYEHIAPTLYATLDGMERVLVISRVSKTVQPTFVRTGTVLNEQLVVFAYDDDSHLGLLSGAFHYWWVISHPSTMRSDLRYTPSDVFETFPQPILTDDMETAGRKLDKHRRGLMLDRQEGLTKTYNRVHNSGETTAGITELRRLHVELDHAVATAYSWGDINLDHGFWHTAQGQRYTIGPDTRREVLDRLLELNHSRHAEEVAAGLHEKRKPKRHATGAASLFSDDP